MTFLQRSEFSGPPSADVDKAWTALYHKYVLSAIPEEQAAHLSNETMRVPGPGHPRYLVGLDVFHQLHCLVSTILFYFMLVLTLFGNTGLPSQSSVPGILRPPKPLCYRASGASRGP